jgi:hypothetical protein
VALAATALGLAGSLALVVAGGGALPGAEARRVTAPRTIAGASVVPAGRWGSDLARLEASVRSARVDATSAAAYGRTRGLLVLLVAGRGAAEGGHERMAAAFAGPDGAVGLSASYQVRGASVRCGDVTATTGRGVLCTWSAATTGAVWAPGAAAIADVAAFSAAAATAVR